MYNVIGIHISGNGDDGKVSSLTSRKVKCSTLFAVYVTRDKRATYGMNFGKTGIAQESVILKVLGTV